MPIVHELEDDSYRRMTKEIPVPTDATDEVDLSEDEEANWLDRMHDFLRWQVLPPKAHVPFGKTLSDSVLEELAQRKDVLMRYVKLRGMIEGDELVLVGGIDPATPRALIIETDHPNIASLSKADFHDYFIRRGIYELISRELEIAQNEYRHELRVRKHRYRKAKG